MIEGLEKGLNRWCILSEADEKKEPFPPLDHKGQQEDPAHDEEKIAPWCMEKCRLDDFPFLEGKAAPHETEEYNRKVMMPMPPI